MKRKNLIKNKADNMKPGNKFFMITSIMIVILLVLTSAAVTAKKPDGSGKGGSGDAKNQIPIARFEFQQLNPINNYLIEFDASNSYDPDGRIVEYYWSYTVGASFPVFMGSSDDPILIFEFEVDDIYEVTLKVTDDGGAEGFVTLTVVIEDPPQPNIPPVAAFTFQQIDPINNYLIEFDASESYDPDGYIIEYYWSYIVEGCFPHFMGSSDDPILIFEFEVDDEYEVTLKVTDNNGAIDTVTHTVIIEDPPNIPPIANFTFQQIDPINNYLIKFNASNSHDPDGHIVEYYWTYTFGGCDPMFMGSGSDPILIFEFEVDVRRLAVETTTLLPATHGLIKVAEFAEAEGFPGPVTGLYLDGQRLQVGLLGGIVLPGHVVDHADLVPGSGDVSCLAKLLEDLKRRSVCSECLVEAALEHPDGAQLGLADGQIPQVAPFLLQCHGLFIRLGCLVEPPEMAETVAALSDGD